MTTKNAKIALFAVLIAATMMPLSGISDVQAQQTAVYDPMVTDYLEEVLQTTGENTEQRVVDGRTVSITTVVTQLSDEKYRLVTTATVDGTVTSSEKFIVTVYQNGTYRLVNEKQEIDETFTASAATATRGSGSSDAFGARIDLHDSEIGSQHVALSDSYSACGDVNRGEVNASVDANNLRTFVTWEAGLLYLHWCFVPSMFDHGEIRHGGSTHYLPSTENREGSHHFSNSGGHAIYDVRAQFVYGSW